MCQRLNHSATTSTKLRWGSPSDPVQEGVWGQEPRVGSGVEPQRGSGGGAPSTFLRRPRVWGTAPTAAAPWIPLWLCHWPMAAVPTAAAPATTPIIQPILPNYSKEEYLNLSAEEKGWLVYQSPLPNFSKALKMEGFWRLLFNDRTRKSRRLKRKWLSLRRFWTSKKLNRDVSYITPI